jgi:hypothetical protein
MLSFTAKPRGISATAATCAYQPAQYNNLPNQPGGTLLIHSAQCSHRPSACTPQQQTQRSADPTLSAANTTTTQHMQSDSHRSTNGNVSTD